MMRDWLSKIWCGWAHIGGDILRDHKGRINWQCRECGRWSDHPVDPTDEEWVLDTEIAAYRTKLKEPTDG